MKILLIAPAIEELRVRDDGKPVSEKMFRFSMLSLLSVAAATPTGHCVRILDELVEPLRFNEDCDLVGITAMTALAPRAYEIADRFRALGKTVVMGGFHATFSPAEALAHVDAVVCGEAEGAWETLLADAAAGRLRRVYRNGAPADLSRLRPVPRRLLHRRGYATVHAVQTARGCDHGCSFCSVTTFHGRRWRARPIESVVEEIAAIGERAFIFMDDNLAADPTRAKEIFRRLIPLKKKWVSQCAVTAADDGEFLSLAAQAGCVGLFIGLESFDGGSLEGVCKEFNHVERYRDAIRRIHSHGICVEAGIVVGFDNDTRAVFGRTLEALDSLGIDAAQISILTPLPGTPLFDRMEAQGRILRRDWRRYDFRSVVLNPAHMAPEDLQAGADWLYACFYSPWRVVRRTLRALLAQGPWQALFVGLVGWAYLRDNIRWRLKGRNPAADPVRCPARPRHRVLEQEPSPAPVH